MTSISFSVHCLYEVMLFINTLQHVSEELDSTLLLQKYIYIYKKNPHFVCVTGVMNRKDSGVVGNPTIVLVLSGQTANTTPPPVRRSGHCGEKN